MGKIIEIKNAVEFEKEVNGNEIVFVDFWAPWCGPCKQFLQIIDKVVDDFNDIVFIKVNVDENSELAQLFNIRSIPTSIIFKKGLPLIGGPGVINEADLRKILQDVIDGKIEK